ncbi:MAG: hypothetical protein J6Z13_07410 [Clostridia bacterium]|nr:hypothetical protein [Clostridia bacterium]
MTALELGIKLKAMYSLKNVNKVAMIHLFGVIFAQTMRSENIKPIEVLKAAKMPESYQTEINKGINLSKYVTVRDEYSDWVDLLND